MELGFKFSSRTVIYILNPCHVITMLQIIMLAAPPTSRVMTVLFRVHVHWINGPLLALLFPVLNTRLLPLEQEVYWVQHGLMLAVPCYLMRLGGVFSTEPLGDLSWALLSIALQYLYHFLILQALALRHQRGHHNAATGAATPRAPQSAEESCRFAVQEEAERREDAKVQILSALNSASTKFIDNSCWRIIMKRRLLTSQTYRNFTESPFLGPFKAKLKFCTVAFAFRGFMSCRAHCALGTVHLALALGNEEQNMFIFK
ncbi:uncharacterized protein LOC144126216 isoform X2 [Amblyomma americanum]